MMGTCIGRGIPIAHKLEDAIMNKKRKTTTEPEYHSLPILTDTAKGLAADIGILERIERQFDHAVSEKDRAFVFRMDLHFPEGMDVQKDNGHFCSFTAAFMKHLSRKGLEPQYFAVREQDKRENPHYHMGVILDGQKTRNAYNHLHKAELLWEHELGVTQDGKQGLVNFCDKDKKTGEHVRNGIMLERGDENFDLALGNCFLRASYMAKVNQKNTPKGQREYFASRLPKKKHR